MHAAGRDCRPRVQLSRVWRRCCRPALTPLRCPSQVTDKLRLHEAEDHARGMQRRVLELEEEVLQLRRSNDEYKDLHEQLLEAHRAWMKPRMEMVRGWSMLAAALTLLLLLPQLEQVTRVTSSTYEEFRSSIDALMSAQTVRGVGGVSPSGSVW